MNKFREWLKFFEKISCFYIQRFMLRNWEREYNKHFESLKDSLCLFLKFYAFERNLNPKVRNNWAETAVDAISQSFKEFRGQWNPQIINRVWDIFEDKIQNTNPKVNPIAPKNTKYRQRNKNKRTSKISLLEVVNLIPDITKSTLTRYLKDQIEQNRLLLVYDFLMRVNGISDKIASFFIRDFLEEIKMPIYPNEKEILAQPVDAHVRETIKELSNIYNLKLFFSNDLSVKIFIVSHARSIKLNPRKINMGVWYFRSQILKGSKPPDCLEDAVELCKEHIKEISLRKSNTIRLFQNYLLKSNRNVYHME